MTRTNLLATIGAVLVLWVVLSIGLACTTEEYSESVIYSPENILQFVPYDIERAEVWDIKRILSSGIPEQEARETEEYLRNYYLGILAPFLNDVEKIILAEKREGKAWILEGALEFARIRQELEEVAWERGEYQGFELWQVKSYPDESVALIENGKYIIWGDEGAVKDLLGALKSGRGFLLDDENDAVARTLVKAMEWGEGGTVVVWDDCRYDYFSECESLGSVVSLVGEEGQYRVKLVFVFLFRTELAAEDEAHEIEKRIRKDLESSSVEDVVVDGEFVVVGTTANLDELYYPYLP